MASKTTSGPEVAAESVDPARVDLVHFEQPAAPGTPELIPANAQFEPLKHGAGENSDNPNVAMASKVEKTAQPREEQIAQASRPGSSPVAAVVLPNPFLVFGVPLVGAAGLLILFRMILGLPPLGLSKR